MAVVVEKTVRPRDEFSESAGARGPQGIVAVAGLGDVADHVLQEGLEDRVLWTDEEDGVENVSGAAVPAEEGVARGEVSLEEVGEGMEQDLFVIEIATALMVQDADSEEIGLVGARDESVVALDVPVIEVVGDPLPGLAVIPERVLEMRVQLDHGQERRVLVLVSKVGVLMGLVDATRNRGGELVIVVEKERDDREG